MADAKTPFERRVATLKDALTATRDALLILLVLLLLIAPKTVNRRLADAGFTSGSIAGLQWKAAVKQASTQAKAAGQQIGDVETKLDDYATRLRAIEAETSDEAVKGKIMQLANEVRASHEAARLADRAVKNSLLTQQKLIEKASPGSVEASGWMFLGTVTEDKERWIGSSTVDLRPSNVYPGALLKVRDEVYLRKDTGAPPRASGAIVGVLGVGTTVEVRHVEYARADGGWLVWADVTRHGPSSRG